MHEDTTMNATRLPLIALAIFATGAAFASDITPDYTAAVPSLKTRAEVRAEFLQARAAGTLAVANEQYAPVGAVQVATPAGARSPRAPQMATASRSADMAQAWYGEDSGSFHMAQQAGMAAAPVFAGLTSRSGR